MKLKIWFLETRPQFLLLSVVLVLLGTAISCHQGHFDWLKFILTTLGLGLGTLPVLGTYFVQTGNYSLEAMVVSLAPGFLTANLLLLNEFPDFDADKKGGRYHIVIALGKRKACHLYAGLMAMTYLSIVAAVVCKLTPPVTLIGLLSAPLALKAIVATFEHHDDFQKMIPALGANVITVLSTNALLALGYFLAELL